MKSNIKLFLVLFFIVHSIMIYGQKKVNICVDYDYLVGLNEKGDFWNIKSGLNGFDLNLSGLYNFSNQLSAGVGIGVEKLYDPSYTIFPIFTKVTYSPFKSFLKPFVFAKIGYGIGTKISNSGLLFNPGFGYKFQLSKCLGLNLAIGYHFQSILFDIVTYSEDGTVKLKEQASNHRNSLSFGVGLVF